MKSGFNYYSIRTPGKQNGLLIFVYGIMLRVTFEG